MCKHTYVREIEGFFLDDIVRPQYECIQHNCKATLRAYTDGGTLDINNYHAVPRSDILQYIEHESFSPLRWIH